MSDSFFPTLVFDLAVYFWRVVTSIFFRSVDPRGSWHIPPATDGLPVIFAGAPHHNQFLDPLLLGSEAKRASGRRVSFLTAEKSLHRKFIGLAARALGSIAVVRAADRAQRGVGRISYWPPDEGDAMEGLRIRGYGTRFTKQLEVNSQLVLPKSCGSSAAVVEEIISDTECRIKRKFKDVPEKLSAEEALSPAEATGTLKSEKSDPKEAVGIDFTVFPHIDQSQMYGQVFKKLNEGGSLGIFPEGGSHDRTDLLPLKRGVVIMALGAMEANPDLKVRIVPVGMSYFHPHKFRSRAVIEFGSPIEVPSDLVQLFSQGGDKKREAVEKMMDIVYDGLKSVTVQAPDYETLQLIQAGRRLYLPPGTTYGRGDDATSGVDAKNGPGPDQDPLALATHASLTLGQVVDLNRRFILGYLRFQDNPEVQTFKAAVLAYNRQLQDAGLRDHQVEVTRQANWHVAGLLLYRIFLLFLWGNLALPGLILNLPIFIVAKVISKKKAKEALAASQVKLQGRDVLATWKVLVSLGMAPILYSIYAIVLAYYLYTRDILPQAHAWWLAPLSALNALPLLAYSTIKFGEAGMDVYKSLPPLFISLIPGRGNQIESLKQTRRTLSRDLGNLIDELAPRIWPDYPRYKQVMIDRARQQRKSAAATVPAQLGVPAAEKYAPPGAWVNDEDLFGWRPSGLQHRSSQGFHSPVIPFVKSQSIASLQEEAGMKASPAPSNGPSAEGLIPDLDLPPAASEPPHDARDETEYQDAMDAATRQVEDYATAFTAQSKAQATERELSARRKPSLTSQKEAGHLLSGSISKLFSQKDERKDGIGRSSIDGVTALNIPEQSLSTATGPTASATTQRAAHLRAREDESTQAS